MSENRFDHMRVVGNAQLVGDGQQQRVGLGDSFVFGIAAAEDRPIPLVDESDLVIIPALEIGAIAVIHQREDAATD